MYEFIKSDEQPFLAEMTTCYEVLCAAVERARNAIELASKVREQASAVFSAALEKRTKMLTGRKVVGEDENSREYAAKMTVANAREQATKQPLMKAIKDTRNLLGRLDCVDKATWRKWHRDVFEINTICLVQTLKKALVVFEKIFPEPLESSKVKLFQDYIAACEFARFVPLFPHDVSNNMDACALIIRCLLDANRSGRKYYVPLAVADGKTVSLAAHYLRMAGWLVRVVLEKANSDWMVAQVLSKRRFELIPPVKFELKKNAALTIRDEK